MTNPVTGEIANIGMVDTVSIGPNGEVYPPLAIGGIPEPLATVKTTVAGSDAPVPVIIVDQKKSIGTHPPVPYSNPPIGNPVLPRPSITPVQNTSVYMEGKLVTVTGDGMAGPPAVPDPRPITGLTSPTLYPTIRIGTNPPTPTEPTE